MSMFVKLAAAAAVAMGFMVAGAVAPVQAETLTLSQISGSGADVSGQLSIEVRELVDEDGDPTGVIGFRFYNDVDGVDALAAYIGRIYFADDNGLFDGFATPAIETSGPDVNYQIWEPNNPNQPQQNLPGGNTIEFVATESAETDGPGALNGVRATGQWVEVYFVLAEGNDWQSVLDALAMGNETLRVGLHVQGIGDEGGSAQFVSNPIPLPAGLVLFLSGLLGIGILGRYKAKRREPATV